jgi:DNA-binding SARP family transcriptional activator
MTPLRIQLFGRFSVSYEGRYLHSFEAGKVQELLCYLVLYRKPHAREMLAGLLWGDNSTSHAKKYLRQALWQLQSGLETNLGPLDQRLALVEADWVSLNPALNLWLDVAEFEKAAAPLTRRSDQAFSSEDAGNLENAIRLYQGDLLQGCYQEWCLYERERLQNIYLATLDRLIGYCEANNFVEQGLSYATEALRFDPARERTHAQLMRLYLAAGDRTAALRQYKRCAVALKTELGVSPSARTTTLFKRIQADEISDSPSISGDDKSAASRAMKLLPEVLEHLKTVRSTLSNIQCQVQKDIREVEMALVRRH